MPTFRVIDSSLLIEADHRRVLVALEKYLRSGPPAIAPPRVYEETVTEPRSIGFGASAARIEKLFSSGAVAIKPPDYTDSFVSTIVDRVRVCIADRAGKPEHTVERADLQIVALAIENARKGNPIEIMFRDRVLKVCLERILRGQGVSGVSIIDFRLLIRQLKHEPKG